MKRFLKIFAIAVIAVAAAVACMFAGCKNDNGNNNDNNKSDYNFTIVYVGGDKDGQAVNGKTDGTIDGKVATQICTDQCIGLPMANIFPDENGKLSLSQAKVNELFSSDTDVTVFVFHALNVTGYKEDCEVAVNGKGDYTLRITVS